LLVGARYQISSGRPAPASETFRILP
jgi:hypothetical protein